MFKLVHHSYTLSTLPAAVVSSAFQTCVAVTELSCLISGRIPMPYMAMARGLLWVVPSQEYSVSPSIHNYIYFCLHHLHFNQPLFVTLPLAGIDSPLILVIFVNMVYITSPSPSKVKPAHPTPNHSQGMCSPTNVQPTSPTPFHAI